MTNRRMASLQAAALLLALSTILHGQDAQQSAQPQQPQQTQVKVAPTSDLFTEELRAARQLHGEWDGLDDQLEVARHGAALGDPQVYRELRGQIDAVLKAKRSELVAWTQYYQKTADYWQSVLKAIQTGQPSRASERQDLVNMLAQEKREREDVDRRLKDLSQTLTEKGITAEQPAVAELRKMLEMKQENIDKLNRAIQEYDGGTAHLDKRRDLARMRSLEARQLLHSVEVERPLWDALYNGKLHRLDLDHDVTIPSPERLPSWRDKLGGSDSRQETAYKSGGQQ